MRLQKKGLEETSAVDSQRKEQIFWYCLTEEMKFIDESNQDFNKNEGQRNHVISIDFSSQKVFKITNYVIRGEEGKPILSVASMH